MEAAEQKLRPSHPPREDYTDRFLAILNNRGKLKKSGDQPVRRNGFVVLARGGDSLKSLQSLCFDTRQSYNSCLTARYRLQSGTVFGTLLAAFVNDLRMRGSTRLKTRGDFSPALADAEWESFLASPFAGWMNSWPANQTGAFTADQIQNLWRVLREESTLPTGKRFVLFLEVETAGAGASNWEEAKSSFFANLPERAGLVLSGAPAEFRLPANDPHFLEILLPASDKAEAKPAGELYFRFKTAALRNDRAAREDHLGVNRFAEAMARFLLHPQTHPPLTIGIHGHWGKGKSSFMAMVDMALIKFAKVNYGALLQQLADLFREIAELEAKLENAPESESEKWSRAKQRKAAMHERVWNKMMRHAEQQVISVSFNAWQFQDAQQIWAGLASVISERIERSLSWWEQVLIRALYTWKKRRAEVFLQIILPMVIATLVGLTLFIGSETPLRTWLAALAEGEKLPVFGALLQFFLPAGSLVFLFWFFSTRLLKVAQPVSERVLGYVQMPQYRDQMGFQHRVMADLQFAYQFLKKQRPECKVVVYVDDLDRCSDEKIMEVLQAINLILGNSELFVFLGMDTEMIYRAIRSHYHQRRQEEFMPENFADEYLRKIIQLSFFLPETKVEQRFDYVRTLFSTHTRQAFDGEKQNSRQEQPSASAEQAPTNGAWRYDLRLIQELARSSWQEVLDTVDELQAFENVRQYLKDNPREIKRIVNVHRLVKILLQGAESNWPPERQRKLVKWLVFCANWPFLIDDLIEELPRMPEGCNCLQEFYSKLEVDESKDKDIAALKEFAEKAEILCAVDLDEEFRLAARLAHPVDGVNAPRKQVEKRFGYQSEKSLPGNPGI
ncbi:MAG: KAP family P-loop NTPase fold protein [bacterium]